MWRVKIGIVGAGAMGSVYAAILGAARNEVWAIDVQAEHIAAIRERGLVLEGPSGTRTVRIHATTVADEAGVCDLVVIAVKAFDVEAAAEVAKPLLGPTTVVVPMQNGLGSADRVAAVLGEDAVAIGVAGGFGASIVRPGHARHNGWELVRLGERRGPVTPRITAVARLWENAGFRVEVYDDAELLVWEKLVCNVCFSGTCSVLGLTIGEVLGDPSAWEVASRCAMEAHAVARARGIRLGFDDPVAYARAFGATIPGAYPSMTLDLMAGRRTEIDVINGAIQPAARDVGLTAPANEVVSALVRARSAASGPARGD